MTAPRHNGITLIADDGALRATWPQRRLRFMFDNGDTVDVLTARDDSDLRGALLAHTGRDAIVGVAEIGPPPPQLTLDVP